VFALAEGYPVLRPCSPAHAISAAALLGERDGTVSRPVVERVMAAIPGQDVDRLVGLADGLAPTCWRKLLDEVGPTEAREPLLVGVVTCAVAELQPPPRWLAEMREATSDSAPGPLNVLATLLHPQSVWSIDEARRAQRLGTSTLPLVHRLRAISSFARVACGPQHLERARRVAKPVARILPLERAPRTSSDLDTALALLRRPRHVAVLCEHLLLTYVMLLEGAVPIVPPLN
jgi:hypothetical protein